jgi:hypothetical protein
MSNAITLAAPTADALVEVDVCELAPGELKVVEWLDLAGRSCRPMFGTTQRRSGTTTGRFRSGRLRNLVSQSQLALLDVEVD